MSKAFLMAGVLIVLLVASAHGAGTRIPFSSEVVAAGYFLHTASFYEIWQGVDLLPCHLCHSKLHSLLRFQNPSLQAPSPPMLGSFLMLPTRVTPGLAYAESELTELSRLLHDGACMGDAYACCQKLSAAILNMLRTL